MLVKKYEAETVEKALALVKEELGADALILSTKRKKDKWFHKSGIEVTAAKPAEEKPRGFDPDSFSEKDLQRIFPHRRREKFADDGFGEEDEVEVAKPVTRPKLNRYLGDAVEAPDKTPKETRPRRPSVRKEGAHPTQRKLEDLGFSTETAKALTGRLVFDYPKEERRTSLAVGRLLTKIIAPKLKTVDRTVFDMQPCWTLIGVAGAGKTSLAVKLALALKQMGKQVSLVGADKRKIAGQRELGAYAKLIGTQFATRAFPDPSSEWIQIIDSPAMNLEGGTGNLRELVDVCRGTQPLLVLDASFRLKEMMRIVDRARMLSPAALAFTRLDVAYQRGVIYEVLRESRLPLLGMSLSGSFKVPFKFFHENELASYLVQDRSEA